MSSRYDPPPSPLPPPLEPPEPVGAKRKQMLLALAAVLITAAIGVAAVFGFDLCELTKGAGVTLDACSK